MIDSWPILSIVTFMPLAGVLFLLMIKGDEITVAQNSRYVALWVSGFTFLVSLPLSLVLIAPLVGYQFEEKGIWLTGTGIGYHMGVDGISMPFVLLEYVSDAVVHSGQLESSYTSCSGIYDRIFGVGNNDDWHVCLA